MRGAVTEARSHQKAVVVGGGLAGITAALDLARGGAEVTLLERRERLGGLTWSFERNGRWFDNGQHVFLRCCTDYQGLLQRLGVAERVFVQPRLDVEVLAPGGRSARLRRNRLPAPLHLAAALARYRHVPVAQRLRIPQAAWALRRLELSDPELDAVSFGDWLRRRGQGPDAVTALWDLITLPTVNLHADQASLALGAKVFRTGLLERSDAGDIGWSAVPLAQLHDAPARRALEVAGVRVALGSKVATIEGSAADLGGAGRLRVCTAEDSYGADAVVLAVPPEVAAQLAPVAAKLPEVAALGTSPIVNVHLVLDRRVTDLPFAAAIGSPIQFVFDRTAAALSSAHGSSRTEEQCLVVSLSAAEEWVGRRPGELIGDFHSALGELFPAARAARLLDAVVTKERAATFRGVPGSRALRPGPVTGCPGLFLAGAWTDTGWPATMEGAVRSGRVAAAEALALGTPPTGETEFRAAGLPAHRVPEEIAR